MAQAEESITSSFATGEPQDDSKPLWRFVTVLEVFNDGGGNKRWRCNFCQKVVKSSYLRVKNHLLRVPKTGVSVCSEVSELLLADLNRICEEAANRLRPKHVRLPTAPSQIPPAVLPPKRKKGSIENAFNVEDWDHLRASIERMFYSEGLSFHLARNPYYVSSYFFAANHNLSGFLPLSYNALRTTLLKQERASY